MHSFTTNLTWKPGTETASLACAGKPDMDIASPPEFGGRADLWSPEDMICGAANSCILLTALYFVGKMQIGLKGYTSSASAAMQKTPAGLRFTGVDVKVTATVATADDEPKMRKAMEQAEKFCPVSAGLSVPVTLAVTITVGG